MATKTRPDNPSRLPTDIRRVLLRLGHGGKSTLKEQPVALQMFRYFRPLVRRALDKASGTVEALGVAHKQTEIDLAALSDELLRIT
ncbi:MAG: hypothetical protein ABSD78_18345 [Acidimicrobiales bacterium]